MQAGAGVARHAATRAGDEAAAGVEVRGKKLVKVGGQEHRARFLPSVFETPPAAFTPCR